MKFCSETKHELETTFDGDNGEVVPVLIKGVIIDEGDNCRYADDIEVIRLGVNGEDMGDYKPTTDYLRKQYHKADQALFEDFERGNPHGAFWN